MSPTQLRILLRRRCDTTPGGQAAVARELGVSPQNLHDILNDRRTPGPTVLRSLGLKRVIRYETSR
jgi:hypothetical protein